MTDIVETAPEVPVSQLESITLTDLVEKYRVEDDRFVFKALYSAEHNVLVNHSEDKVTGEIYRSENLGEFDGKVKFDPTSINTYIQQAIGSAFPVLEEPIGFIFSYDDLVARKYLMTDERFSELVAKYPRLNRRVTGVTDSIRLISKTRVDIDFATGVQHTTVLMDNTADNWWSSMSTPEYKTSDVMSPDEMIALQTALESIVYSDPIERYVWKQIKAHGEVITLAQVMLDDNI